jgi:hypothetical protein
MTTLAPCMQSQRLARGFARLVTMAATGTDSASRGLASVCIGGAAVPVTGEAGVDLAKVVEATVLQEWAASVPKNMAISKIHVQSLDLFGVAPRQRVGFIKFVADNTVDGHPAPGIVFMRGGAVAVLVVIECEGEEFALLVRQPRLPIASGGFDEIPAGMLDGSGHFSGEGRRSFWRLVDCHGRCAQVWPPRSWRRKRGLASAALSW